MFRDNPASKWIVVTIVALLAGFAPIFHSLCIQAVQSSASSHIMADGTIMQMTTETAADTASGTMTQEQSAGHVQAPVKAPSMPLGGDPLALVVLFIVPACLLLVGLLLIFRKALLLKFSERIFRLDLVRPPTWRHFPNAVDALALGVSRT